MSLKDEITAAVVTAMKAKESEKVSILRMVTAAIKNKEIELRPTELTDKDVMSVLKKLSKQMKDSIEQYQNAGRTDLVEKEQKELKVIEAYLPQQMSEDKVKEIVNNVIKETGASSMKDMGKVMQAVTAQTQGAADNKIVSQFIKSLLQ